MVIVSIYGIMNKMFFFYLMLFSQCILLWPLQSLASINNSSTLDNFPGRVIRYHINPDLGCGDTPNGVLIAVHSAPKNFHLRNLIRSTYGSIGRVSSFRTLLDFILGEVKNSNVQHKIEGESRMYADIIQANFVDSYFNLSLKHVALLNWINHHCSELTAFAKVDDDTMVDVFHLVYFLETHRSVSDFYCKSLYINVFRSGKWAVSQEMYNETHYPEFCEGFAYVYTNMKRLPQWVEVAFNTSFFWIDDVFITGIVRKKVGLKVQWFPKNFEFFNIDTMTPAELLRSLFIRNGDNSFDASLWFKIWRMILRKSYDIYLL